jgi:hypothetical protein
MKREIIFVLVGLALNTDMIAQDQHHQKIDGGNFTNQKMHKSSAEPCQAF